MRSCRRCARYSCGRAGLGLSNATHSIGYPQSGRSSAAADYAALLPHIDPTELAQNGWFLAAFVLGTTALARTSFVLFERPLRERIRRAAGGGRHRVHHRLTRGGDSGRAFAYARASISATKAKASATHETYRNS
jgi:peptidoglycan/LPS O-acetylase OafA/YrhL